MSELRACMKGCDIGLLEEAGEEARAAVCIDCHASYAMGADRIGGPMRVSGVEVSKGVVHRTTANLR